MLTPEFSAFNVQEFSSPIPYNLRYEACYGIVLKRPTIPAAESGFGARFGPNIEGAGHGCPPHRAPVMPWPSVIVKIRSIAGSFTVSFSPAGRVE